MYSRTVKDFNYLECDKSYNNEIKYLDFNVCDQFMTMYDK